MMCTSSGSIESKQETFIIEKEELFQSRNEHVGELFHDARDNIQYITIWKKLNNKI